MKSSHDSEQGAVVSRRYDIYVVSCMSTITMDKEEAICLNEHRSVVTTVECEDDIFFDMGSLICELDDICLFELLADVDATIYEL